ncbi:MAG: hypothetical protein QME66_05880 [Candidatus Eisenbacteria bacterium]|nr:hypothetical protein [Candidatus Eisenbacteria bacterium]
MKRHGDVVLVKIDALPADAKSLGVRKELVFGEVTGHAHRIDVGELFETRNGELYLKMPKAGKLTHEEHAPSPVERETYRVIIKRQYTPDGGWAKVVD